VSRGESGDEIGPWHPCFFVRSKGARCALTMCGKRSQSWAPKSDHAPASIKKEERQQTRPFSAFDFKPQRRVIHATVLMSSALLLALSICSPDALQ
jgi:hypothetical protein